MSIVRQLKAGIVQTIKSQREKREKQKEREKEKKAGHEPEQEEQKEKPEPFGYLEVVAADLAKVDKEVFERLKNSGPFTPHLPINGNRWVPVTVIQQKGTKLILPLENLIMENNEFRVAQHNLGNDFTRANLTLLPEMLELEVFTTIEEYQKEQLCRREKLRKKKH